MSRRRLVVALALIILTSAPLVASMGFPAVPQEKNRDSLIRLAQGLQQAGRFQEAVKVLHLAGADTGSAHERHNLGFSYSALNDFRKGVRFLAEAVAMDSGNVTFRYQLARYLMQSGATNESRAQFEVILCLDSNFVPALTALGQMYNEPETYEKSAEMFRRALQLNPQDYLSRYYLANVMIGLLHNDSALVLLRSCLELNPVFVPALNVAASVLYSKKQSEEALDFYLRAVALRPKSAEILNKAGLCCRALERFDSAAAFFRQAAERDSLTSSYFGNLGHAYYILFRYDSAALAYKHATVLEKENTTYLANLALALQRLDSIPAAALAYRRAIAACHPEMILEFQVKLGSLYFLAKEHKSAIECYEVALRTDPENRDARFFLASAHDYLKEYKAAVLNYNRYLKLAESPPPETERIAWTQKRLRAIEYLQSVERK